MLETTFKSSFFRVILIMVNYMRVISGFLKKREIKGYTIDGTRPTMDRVKESMFAIIQDSIKDKVCLDLFAGSGNLGIEAISNGAKKCYFVDNNKEAIKVINENVENLGIKDKSEVIHKDYMDALLYFKENRIKFHLVFLDPPYSNDVINDILKFLYKNKILKRDAIVICEYQKGEIESQYFEVEREKKFGYKKIGIYTQK